MCSVGWGLASPAAISCSRCQPGQASPGGANATCSPCPEGQYAASAGLPACTNCPAGSYSSAPGADACSLCGIGQISTATGATACQGCPIGFTTTTSGSTACTGGNRHMAAAAQLFRSPTLKGPARALCLRSTSDAEHLLLSTMVCACSMRGWLRQQRLVYECLWHLPCWHSIAWRSRSRLCQLPARVLQRRRREHMQRMRRGKLQRLAWSDHLHWLPQRHHDSRDWQHYLHGWAGHCSCGLCAPL